MDTHPRYALVGVVVVLLLSALAFWFAWLWRGDSRDNPTLYSIYFRKQSLSGLQVDSIVTMRGIKVGTVKTIAIQPQDIERVRVTIALAGSTPVRTDTRAVIARNLLTGMAGIDLVGSTQAAEPLTKPENGDYLPAIKEGQAALDKVQQSVPEMMGKASVVLDQIALVLSDQNIENVEKTLKNIEVASAALAKLDPVLTSADKTFSGLGDLVSDAKGKLSPSLDEFGRVLREIRESSKGIGNEFTTLLRSLTATSSKLQEPRSAVLGLPSGKYGPGESK